MNEKETEFKGFSTDIDEPVEKEPAEETQSDNKVDDAPPEDEKIEVNIREEVKGDLMNFYKFIKKDKYIHSPDKWPLRELKDDSPKKLAPIIREFKIQLIKGGAAEPDVIIQEIIDIALDHLKSGKSRWEFLDQITDPAKINPDSQIAKFNRFIAKSLVSEKK